MTEQQTNERIRWRAKGRSRTGPSFTAQANSEDELRESMARYEGQVTFDVIQRCRLEPDPDLFDLPEWTVLEEWPVADAS